MINEDILIRNGTVYDPVNGIAGEKKDIFISKGKIVGSLIGKKVRTIDASGKVVMPSGVDIHSHIAGGKVNMGRLFRPEDSVRREVSAVNGLRSGTGFSIPSTFITGYLYARMGYTLVNEPAVPPLKARHTHEEFNDTPMIDKLGLLLLGNNQQLIEYISNGEKELLSSWVAFMLNSTKTYGIKAVNPGGTLAWGWGKNVLYLDDEVPYFNVTPREIIKNLIRIGEELSLPHPLHIHLNNLGNPGNYETALESFKFSPMHITHIQFSSYGGDSWKNFCSEAERVANEVNKKKGITVDLGQVVFGDTTTMTADAPFEYHLGSLNRMKWNNADVEDETGGGVVPYIYREKSGVNSVQWAIGLEMALHIKDPWRVFLTTDHPNAAPFVYYPRIIAWLMSRDYRDDTMKGCSKWAVERTTLASLDRELSMEEIAIMTRAGPARRLGLDSSLSEGSDANIAIYDLDPEENNGKKIEDAFSSAAYTIKGGEIVVKDGKVVKEVSGKTFWVKSRVERDLGKDIGERFLYYTINPENYEVGLEYLPGGVEIAPR
jgi:formylmethanofuran dehydrogenase subunit A